MDTLNKILILLVVVLALVVVLTIVVIWSKFAALPAGAKVLVVVCIGLVALTMALLFGWIMADQLRAAGIPTSLDEASAKATGIWLKFDAFTRDYPLVGVLMLCSIPIIFWPAGDVDE
jgi:hypothetical protein